MKQILVKIALCCVHTLCVAAPCPEKVPEGLSPVHVGSDVITNGLAMAITQVSGKGKVDSVLDRVESDWSTAGYDVRRNVAAGWKVVSARGKGCLVTLQLVNRDGVFGYLTRSKSATTVITPAKMGVVLPRDATVTSSVASEDDGRRGLTLSLTSSSDVDKIRDFFTSKLVDQDWKAVRAHRIDDGRSGKSMQFVSAQRGRQQVEIVIWREQSSQIVMTVSDAL